MLSKYLKAIFSFYFFFFLLPVKVQASVVISEIYPNPLENEKEAVEIYNPDQTLVKIDNWEIWDSLSSPSLLLTLSGLLEPNEAKTFYLNSNKLNNAKETVVLKNNQGEQVDQVSYTNAPKGKSFVLVNPNTHQFLWKDPSFNQVNFNLLTSAPPTPTSTNLSPTPALTPSNTPTNAPVPTSTPLLTPTPKAYILQPKDITLTEVLACPDTGLSEWIELKSNLDKEVDTKLILTDTASNQLEFEVGLLPQTYQTLELNRAILNNSGDQITLTNASGDILTQLDLPACKVGESYALIQDRWQLTNKISQGKSNPTASSTLTPTPTPASLSDQETQVSITPTLVDNLKSTSQTTKNKLLLISSLNKKPNLKGCWQLPQIDQADHYSHFSNLQCLQTPKNNPGQVLGASISAQTHTPAHSTSPWSVVSVIISGGLFILGGLSLVKLT